MFQWLHLFSSAASMLDLGLCTDCQQGGLLQLGSRWYPRPAARPAAVRLECRRPFGFLSEAVRTHNPIALWTPLVESSRASHIPAVRSGPGLPLSSWNSAGVPCWEPAPDIWRQHSTLSALCWLSHAGGTVHQTFNTRWLCLPSGFGTCVEQPAVVCQECTVADDVPSRAEGCTFPVIVWQWLGDRDCTAQYNCCLPATTDCRRFCRFVFFSFLFNFVRCPCNVFDVIVSP